MLVPAALRSARLAYLPFRSIGNCPERQVSLGDHPSRTNLSCSHSRCYSTLPLGSASGLALFPGLFNLAVPGGKDLVFTPFQLVLGRYVAQGTV